MRTRLFIFILMLLGMAAGAQAYTLKVGGVTVTSSNASNVTGNNIKAYSSSVNGGKPSVVYNESTKTLTLWNVKIDRTGSDNRAILNEDVSGLTIILKGTNYLKAADSSPVRLNAMTTMKCQAYNGSMKTYIYGGSEDALTVGNSQTLIIENADLYLESMSSCFDASGSPSLYIQNSTITAKCTYNKNNDCYALFDYKLLSVTNSTVTLQGYSQAVKNLTNYSKAARMYVKTPSGGKFDSSKKTFVNSSGTAAGTVVLDIDNETGLAINLTNFPDANFYNYVSNNCDPNGNGILSDTELKNVKTIDIKGKNIYKLNGIEYFTELTTLDCSNNKLTALDLTKNTKLTTVNCYANKIGIDNMASLIASLPKRTSGTNYLGVVASSESSYGNTITYGQVQTAAAKGWTVSKWTGSGFTAYAGTAPASYGLSVGGVDVSYDNYSNVSGTYIKAYSSSVNGGKASVSYNPSTKTLTIWNVKIERTGNNNRAILNDACPDLKIVLKGQNLLKATASAPVRLNAATTISSNDSETTTITGGSEDAFYVGNNATVRLSGVNLNLTSESSCFDTSGSPTLYIENSTITAKCTKDKSGDCYALYDYHLVNVRYSNVTLEGYSQAVKNVPNLELGPGMYIKNSGWYSSDKKTFYDKNNNIAKTVELAMGTDLSYKAVIYDGMKWDDKIAAVLLALQLESFFSVTSSGGIDYYKTSAGKVLCTHNWSKSTLGVPGDVNQSDFVRQPLSDATQSALLASGTDVLDGYKSIRLDMEFTINEQNFPDKNLREYIKKWDFTDDGRLSAKEVDFEFGTFDVRNKEITNMKGIEYFNCMTKLNCGYNKFTSLDLSNCKMLESLYCEGNYQLEILVVAGLENLTTIKCNYAPFKSLDLTGCKALNTLTITTSKLEELILPPDFNNKLEFLECENCELKSLDCSKNQKLNTIKCKGNKLTELKLGSLQNLTLIDCSQNELTELDVSGCSVSSLYCKDNQLESIDVDYRCKNLSFIDCRNNSIKLSEMGTLVSGLPSWSSPRKGRLVVYDPLAPKNNEISAQQVAKAKNKGWDVLQVIDSEQVDYEGLIPDGLPIDETNFPDQYFRRVVKELDPDQNGYLTDEEIQDVAEIRAGSRSMKDLTGIEVFTNLRYLDCSGNDLTELDLSKNKKLQVVKCYSNKISGTNTDYLIEHLPTTTGGELYFIREWGESNKITEQQKAAAKAKGWRVLTSEGSEAPTVGGLIGDVNGDDKMDVADVTLLISYLTTGQIPSGFSLSAADANGDGLVDDEDVRTMIDMIINN